jgi:hypothetical protein
MTAAPNRKTTGLWLAVQAWLIWALVRLLLALVRLRRRHGERLQRARAGGRPLLYAFWHGRQLALFKANPERGRRLAVMTSLSRDGSLQSLVCRRFGLEVVRGSSSRSGLAGLLAMGRRLRAGASVAVAVDGPRGPALVAKPGIIALAWTAGLPIVPITVGFRRRWVLHRTWDRFAIPKPFTRATVAYGEPLWVTRRPEGCDAPGLAAELGRRLRALDAEVDAA